MKVQLKLFAAARQLVARDVIELTVPEEATVADLRQAIASEFSALADLLPHVVFAINTEYANDETRIAPHAEVACIPPVSGG